MNPIKVPELQIMSEAERVRAMELLVSYETSSLPNSLSCPSHVQDGMAMRAVVVAPRAIHLNARAHGWYDSPDDYVMGSKMCLIHSEISEGLEALRDRIPEGEKGCFSEEMADAVIRIFDLCALVGVDIIAAIAKKHKTNISRPYRHGGKAL